MSLKRNFNLCLLVLLFLLVGNVVLYFNMQKNKRKYNNFSLEYKRINQESRNKDRVFNSILLDYRCFVDSYDLCLVNQDMDSLFLYQSNETPNYLVFNFSRFNCNTCFEKELSRIKGVISKENADKILIVSDYSDYRYLRFLKKKYDDEFNFYYKAQWMDLEIDKANLPYYYVLHNDHISHIHYVVEEEGQNNKLNNYLLNNNYFVFLGGLDSFQNLILQNH